MVKKYGNISKDDARFGLQLAKMRLGAEVSSTDTAVLMQMAYECVVETNPAGPKNSKRVNVEEEKLEEEVDEEAMTGFSRSEPMLLDPETENNFLTKVARKVEPVAFGEPICLRVTHKGSPFSRSGLPSQLAAAGVTVTEWTQIWDSVETGWAKAWADAQKFDEATLSILADDDRPLNKKALTMVMCSSQAMVGLTTHAANALALANLLLNPKGIFVQLLTQSAQVGLPTYEECDGSFVKPVGLEMINTGAVGVPRTKATIATKQRNKVTSFNKSAVRKSSRSNISALSDGFDDLVET